MVGAAAPYLWRGSTVGRGGYYQPPFLRQAALAAIPAAVGGWMNYRYRSAADARRHEEIMTRMAQRGVGGYVGSRSGPRDSVTTGTGDLSSIVSTVETGYAD